MKIVEGNLLDMADAGEFDAIIQGCNCWNVMGGGIAAQIRVRYPEAAEVDNQTTPGDYNKLGNFTVAPATEDRNFAIINAYTQFNTSRNTDVFEYEAFILICKKIGAYYGNFRIGIPEIGCGLAGGDAVEIYKIFEYLGSILEDQGGSLTVVKYKP